MAFIRAKKGKKGTYYQLVENYREDGRVRQRVLCHLGRNPTLEAAIEERERYLAWAQRGEQRCREEARLPRHYQEHPDQMPARGSSGRRWVQSYWRRLEEAEHYAHMAQRHATKLKELQACSAQ